MRQRLTVSGTFPGEAIRFPIQIAALHDGAQQQLAAEMGWSLGFVESTPLLPEATEVELGEARERLPGKPSESGFGGSYRPGRGDAVNPAAFLFCRSKGQSELLLQGSREKAAHGMPLPASGTHHFIDRRPLRASQHRNDFVVLRQALRLRLRLGIL